MSQHSPSSYSFGPFELDTRNRLLKREGTVVPLTPKVFDTLLFLVENAGRVLTKDEMMQRLWPDSFVEEKNLAQNIFTLRRALGEDEKYIDTVPKRGYRFVPEVTPLHQPHTDIIYGRRVHSEVVIEQEIEDEEPHGGQALLQAPTRREWWKRPSLLAGLAVVLGLVVLAGFWIRSEQVPETPAEVKSIAVLPFRIIAGAGDDQYLAVGMADALITRLSRVGQIAVRPTRAILKYESFEQDPLSCGRELKVESLVDGKIQRLGDRLRVTVQLLRVSDGAPLWADTFEERFSDIFAVQDSIANRVTQAMLPGLSSGSSRSARAANNPSPEAYNAYLKGRYFWNKRTDTSLRQAQRFYDQALASDPQYAQAYVGLAECYVLYSTYGVMPAREAFPKAEVAAAKALAIDEELAEAHASLGVVQYEYHWNWAAADQEFKRAIELAPAYATARQWYGGFLMAILRHDEGIREIEKAQQLDPLSPVINASVGWFYYFKRDYDRAIEEGRKAIEMDEGSSIGYYFLGQAYLQKGLHSEAVAALQKSVDAAPGEPGQTAVLIHALSAAGNKAAAQKLLDQLLEQSRRGYVPPFNIAEAYTGIGDSNRALDYFERAFEERSPDLVGLKMEPRLDSLRSEPRYIALINRIGFPE